MTPELKKMLAGIVIGAVSAIITDLDAFLNARKSDPKATFGWDIAIARALRGANAGALGGAGLAAVG
jgi:hypothetical protein